MKRAWILGCLLLCSCSLLGSVKTSESDEIKRDIAEIKEGQRKILDKLTALETAQGPRRPMPPVIDYARAYEIDLGDSPAKGDAKAPVTIVEFSDYQCPFCAQVLPAIDQVLAESKGKARLVFKNLPLESIHPMARPAALAALAAGAQGKYWEMHDALFALRGQLSEEKIVEAAKTIGLDMAKFDADRKGESLAASLKKDLDQAQKAEVRGTPTFFVNGKRVSDRSPEGFRKMIEEALAK